MYGAYSDHLEPNQPTRTQPAVAQHEDGRSGASSWRPAEEPPRGYARSPSGPGYTANVRQETAVPRQRYSTIPEENYRPAPRQDFSHPLAPTSPLKPNSAKSESAERSFQCVKRFFVRQARPSAVLLTLSTPHQHISVRLPHQSRLPLCRISVPRRGRTCREPRP